MNELTLRWKIFRLLCIFQLLAIVYPLVIEITYLFDGNDTLRELINIVCYGTVFIYVCLGLSVLSENYPDTPLSTSQKRRFNLLFLFNFLLIAFLFAKVVSGWWIVPYIFNPSYSWNAIPFVFIFTILLRLFTFVFHLAFLWGMYRLRQQIHQNSVTSWYEQFDHDAPGR
jgi:amino acid transporter